MKTEIDPLQLDLATVIARIEQYAETRAEWLLDRIIECDVPRLRSYLEPETLALLRDAQDRHGGS